MLNCEKYREDIEKLEYYFCVKKSDNKLVSCGCAKQCKDCKFSSYYNNGAIGCDVRRIKWLMSEYKEQKLVVDWSKVPVDTPVICNEQFRRYFAKFENGKIYTWCGGRTSLSCIGNTMGSWEKVELAESHPEWMKEVE